MSTSQHDETIRSIDDSCSISREHIRNLLGEESKSEPAPVEPAPVEEEQPWPWWRRWLF